MFYYNFFNRDKLELSLVSYQINKLKFDYVKRNLLSGAYNNNQVSNLFLILIQLQLEIYMHAIVEGAISNTPKKLLLCLILFKNEIKMMFN